MSSDTVLDPRGASIARGLGSPESIRWPLVRASAIFELRYGKALVEASRRPGSIPVYGTNGRTGSHDTALFSGPGVIIGRKGAGNLGVEWAEGDYWVIDTAYSLTVAETVDLKFAYYLVKHVGLNHLKHGTSNPSLTRDAFGAQFCPVPPLNVQRGIAATLGALDDRIASNSHAIRIALGLLDAMAAQIAELLPTVELGSLASLNRATVNPNGIGEAQVDLYSLPAFDDGARPETVSAPSIMSNKIALSGRSVLVSRLNPRINRTWWANPRTDVPALASTEFACLTTADDDSLAALWLAVRDAYFRDELTRRVTGTSGSHQRVRRNDLMAIEVPDVRALSLDTKKQVLALVELVHQRREESADITSLRDALLPELLAGRVRVAEAAEAAEAAHEAVG